MDKAGQAPATPADSPLKMEDALASSAYRELSTPKLAIGDPAFDFELPLLDVNDGTLQTSGDAMRLRDFRGLKPVALVFGSYT